MVTSVDFTYYVSVRHICGHWERHPLPERAEPEVVEANLKSQRCSRCEAKEKERLERVQEVHGKYAGLGITTDGFIKEKERADELR